MVFWEKFLNSLNRFFLVKILVSPKVVATLIALLTFFSFLGVVIPQRFVYPPEYMEKWRQDYPTLSRIAEVSELTNLFYSWWFLLLLFLFFLSLFLCTVLRLKPARGRFPKLKPSKVFYLARKPDVQRLKAFFSRRFYRVRVEERGKNILLCVQRFDTRFFSILFHLGIAILLLATAADKSSGLVGSALLTEGETFIERHSDYETLAEAPFFSENHQFFKVRLEDFKVWYEGDVLTDAEAKVRLVDKDLNEIKAVRVNYPLSYKGFSFLIKQVGFSPLIELTDRKGNVLFSSYVSLGEEIRQGFADFFKLGEYKWQLTLYPNTLNPRKIYLAQVPRLEVKVKDKDKGKVFWQGVVYQGQVVETPFGYLSFADLRYWVHFQVAYSPFLPLIFFGFFLSILGLSVRLIFYPRAFTVELRPKGRRWEVALGGKSRLGKIVVGRELKKIERYLNQGYN